MSRLRLIIPILGAVVAAAIAGGVCVTFMGLYSQELAPASVLTQLARLAMVLALSILLSPFSVLIGSLPASIGLIVGAPLHVLMSRFGLTGWAWYVGAGGLAGLFVSLLLPVFFVACLIAGPVGGLVFHRLAKIGRRDAVSTLKVA